MFARLIHLPFGRLGMYFDHGVTYPTKREQEYHLQNTFRREYVIVPRRFCAPNLDAWKTAVVTVNLPINLKLP